MPTSGEQNGDLSGVRSSSPAFTGLQTSSHAADISSPMHLPTSSPRGEVTPRASRGQDSVVPYSQLQFIRGPEPLFMSAMSASTPRRMRRGDIHSSAPLTTPTAQATRVPAGSTPGAELGATSDREVTLSVVDATDEHDKLSNPGLVKVIWGTNIALHESMTLFRDFIRQFKPKYRAIYDTAAAEATSGQPGQATSTARISEGRLADPSNRPLYVDYLNQMLQTGETNLNVDSLNLLSWPPTKRLYHQLVNYPQDVVPIMDQVLRDMMIELVDEELESAHRKRAEGVMTDLDLQLLQDDLGDVDERVYKVRPFGGESITNLRDLNPGDTDKLISIKGLVIRATPVIPEMSTAFFRCTICHHTLQVEIDRGRISEPDVCPREECKSAGTMTLVHNRSDYTDKQIVRLQETPDAVPDGQTPHTVSICMYDELVDTVKPGDRVVITGIFRSTPVRVNPRQRSIKSLFKTYVDVIHVKRTNTARLGHDPSTRASRPRGFGIGDDDDDARAFSAVEPSTDKIANLEKDLIALSQHPDVYDTLARSMAPSIYEMEDVKKGILLQLFGGTNKSIARGGGGGGPRYRGDINVLMVGDPGTSKSQILQYVHRIAPRGVYTSGKGSSAVGLTAYVTRDPDSKQLVLESGALVLSDGGVCCIDEFDKMSDATRSVLHEVMEQQTVSIAKAGIITTLNARTSILAAANPVGSKYDPKLPVPANIDLPPTLISRFDLLYLVLDKVDEVNDRRLAKHLVSLYLEDRPNTGGEDVLPLDTLTAYITYARSKIHPVLTESASDALIQAYVEMRKAGQDSRTSQRRITATTRQLESMIRLSEAHARMRFSEAVELEDVIEASRLIRSALRDSATDPLTGQIDLDLINTGAGQAMRRARADIKRELLAIVDAAGRFGVRWSAATRTLEAQSSASLDHAEFADVVRGLVDEGAIRVVGTGEKRSLQRTAE